MSLIRLNKSKKAQATDWLTTLLKVGALGAAARGAGIAAKTGAKKGAKRGAKKAAAKGGKSVGKRLAPVALVGTGAFVAVRRLRGKKKSGMDSWQAAPAAAPTPVAPPEPATRP